MCLTHNNHSKRRSHAMGIRHEDVNGERRLFEVNCTDRPSVGVKLNFRASGTDKTRNVLAHAHAVLEQLFGRAHRGKFGSKCPSIRTGSSHVSREWSGNLAATVLCGGRGFGSFVGGRELSEFPFVRSVRLAQTSAKIADFSSHQITTFSHSSNIAWTLCLISD